MSNYEYSDFPSNNPFRTLHYQYRPSSSPQSSLPPQASEVHQSPISPQSYRTVPNSQQQHLAPYPSSDDYDYMLSASRRSYERSHERSSVYNSGRLTPQTDKDPKMLVSSMLWQQPNIYDSQEPMFSSYDRPEHQYQMSSRQQYNDYPSSQSPPPYDISERNNRASSRASYSMALEPDQRTLSVSTASLSLDTPRNNKKLAVAIPQMSKGRGTPFQRLWTPKLENYDISETEFIDFLDTLNIVSAASPPLKVLDLAGGIIGMVPHHWAMIASNAIRFTSKAGTALVSKSRTDSFLEESNKKIFAPHGLRVALITTEALLVAIGFPKSKTVTLPLDASVPLDQQPKFHTRLLQGLKGYVTDSVPTEIPAKQQAENTIDKLSAGQVKRDIARIDKKLLKENGKQLEKMNKRHDRRRDSSDSDDSRPYRSKSLERKIRMINKDADRDLERGINEERVERERAREIEKEMEKSDRKARRHRSKSPKGKKQGADDKFAEKLLWIYVEPVPTTSTS